MTVIDTNVILRYLLNDVPEQADEAAKIIGNGAKSFPEIIAEVVYASSSTSTVMISLSSSVSSVMR